MVGWGGGSEGWGLSVLGDIESGLGAGVVCNIVVVFLRCLYQGTSAADGNKIQLYKGEPIMLMPPITFKRDLHAYVTNLLKCRIHGQRTHLRGSNL